MTDHAERILALCDESERFGHELQHSPFGHYGAGKQLLELAATLEGEGDG